MLALGYGETHQQDNISSKHRISQDNIFGLLLQVLYHLILPKTNQKPNLCTYCDPIVLSNDK